MMRSASLRAARSLQQRAAASQRLRSTWAMPRAMPSSVPALSRRVGVRGFSDEASEAENSEAEAATNEEGSMEVAEESEIEYSDYDIDYDEVNWEKVVPEKYHGVFNFSRVQAALADADNWFFSENYTYTDTSPFDTRPRADVTEAELDEAAAMLEHQKFMKKITQSCWIKTVGRRRLTPSGTKESYTTLVIGGTEAGSAAYGIGMGEDPMLSWENSVTNLRKNMLNVELFEKRTLYHPVVGTFKTTKVVIIPLPRGRGRKTNSPLMSEIFECFGIDDVTSKIHGSKNPFNIIKAVWSGISKNQSFRQVALGRGKNVYTMLEPRIVRPRFPSNKDMDIQREMVANILKDTQAAYEDRKITQTEIDRAVDELEAGQMPRFIPDMEGAPSVPAPMGR